MSMQAAANFELEMEALRTRFNLKRMSSEHEGLSVAQLPGGIFGYGLANPNLETPLFAGRVHQAFEYHKRDDSSIHLLGYGTSAEAAALEADAEPVDFKLYPEPHGESAKLCVLPLSRIRRAKAPSRADGNFIAMNVDPSSRFA